MKDHKESLAILADQLAAEMSNITANFRLGFGSFIDKITMPFASMVPRKLINPCSDGVECIKPYSFRNHLSLTQFHDQFTTEVKSAGLSGNLDNAEGGLDAIVQSIVCKDQIKWDADSSSDSDHEVAERVKKIGGKSGKIGAKSELIRRKILLFATGSEFHFAGDGKLGGVIGKNDLQCHLDSNGYYDASLMQDYPSVYQVAKVISSNKVNLIFAVTPEAVPIYEKLSGMIDGATLGILSSDSSNIVSLVRKNYDKIVSRIELISDANNEGLSINFKSKCKGKKLLSANYCNEIKIGDSVEFEVEISAKHCPTAHAQIPKFVKISPIGLNVETIVELNIICSCDCEHAQSIGAIGKNSNSKNRTISSLQTSKECNFKGSLSCGICACTESSFGKFCECKKGGKDEISNEKLNECRRPLPLDGSPFLSSGENGIVSRVSKVECSNRGVCTCGICSCDSPAKKGEMFYGKYCECDTFTCERSPDGAICGGHGKCCDGLCTCDPGWSGSGCDCVQDDKSCLGPNGKVCSGHGDCFCGQCRCHEGRNRVFEANVSTSEVDVSMDEKVPYEQSLNEKEKVLSSSGLFYVGTFCEQCLNCDGRCSDIEECIKCHLPGTDSILSDEACAISCLKFEIYFLSDANDTSLINTNEDTLISDGKLINTKLINERSLDFSGMKKCKLTDGDGCYIDFFYEFNYESERANVFVNTNEKLCPESLNVWIIVGSITALIVLIGLILILIFRFFVYLKDRANFLKWQEEVENSKKDLGSKNTNPLYREANTKYNNPLYGN